MSKNKTGNSVKEKSLSEKFTLIVTVREREEWVVRNCKLYAQMPFNVVIADSSKLVTHDLAKIAEETTNIVYLYSPECLYYEIIHKATEVANTEYVAILPDDEIMYPGAIEKCVSFLEENRDYSFCDGYWDRWERWDKKVTDQILLNLKTDNIKKRIEVLSRKEYWKAPNSAVVRSSVSQEIHRFLCKNEELQPVRYYDKIWLFIALCQGNFKPVSYIIGSRNPISTRYIWQEDYPKEMRRDLSFDSILEENRLEALVKYFQKYGYDESESEKFINSIFKTGFREGSDGNLTLDNQGRIELPDEKERD